MLSTHKWGTDGPADDRADILLPKGMFRASVGLPQESGQLAAAGVLRIDPNGFDTYFTGRVAPKEVGDQLAIYRKPLEWSGLDAFRAQGTTRHRPLDEGDRAAMRLALDARVAELHSAAEDEGIGWSAVSERGMRGFLERSGTTAIPLLTLRPDGNLRALWERTDGAQIGLQFLDQFRIGYVLFAPTANDEIDRHFGTTVRSRVSGLIRHLQLHSLLVA